MNLIRQIRCAESADICEDITVLRVRKTIINVCSSVPAFVLPRTQFQAGGIEEIGAEA
jgi:hypothetical protein